MRSRIQNRPWHLFLGMLFAACGENVSAVQLSAAGSGGSPATPAGAPAVRMPDAAGAGAPVAGMPVAGRGGDGAVPPAADGGGGGSAPAAAGSGVAPVPPAG
jgi:hypothetical protein